MSKPRVFVSSTYFDLKHVRSSLESFISALGFDVVLSEKGKIAYSPDLPLDESCYKEAQSSDILVLIVGGRYGAEASPRSTSAPKAFFERYNSITQKEYIAARDKGIPIYILVERNVYSEYETYLRNKNNKDVIYAHVDSVNIFELIEDIVSQPRNNPIHQFDKQSDIENWLRDQWAGLFRELLQRMQGQEQMATLQAQVAQLSEINTTLKRYLETVVESVAPKESKALIETEARRLDDARVERALSENALGRHLLREEHLSVGRLRECLSQAKSVSGFLALLSESPNVSIPAFSNDEGTQRGLLRDINAMLSVLDLPLFPEKEHAIKPAAEMSATKRSRSQNIQSAE